MVKSLAAIGASILLLLGLALFEWSFVTGSFREFREEIGALAQKTEREEAEENDARVAQERWEMRKSTLHIWIPHNDVNKIDDYMAEAVRLIGEKEYTLALGKLEIILHLSECVPGTYMPQIENIF